VTDEQGSAPAAAQWTAEVEVTPRLATDLVRDQFPEVGARMLPGGELSDSGLPDSGRGPPADRLTRLGPRLPQPEHPGRAKPGRATTRPSSSLGRVQPLLDRTARPGAEPPDQGGGIGLRQH
jgi:hypothetical protein